MRKCLQRKAGKPKVKSSLRGKMFLKLLHQATDLAGGNSRYAVEIAQRLSDQLGTAENRVAELEARIVELEAEVKFYRDKSEKAELWLGKIFNEIQERVLENRDISDRPVPPASHTLQVSSK